MVAGKQWQLTRLAWRYVHGEWPRGRIEQISDDPSDYRIANLRYKGADLRKTATPLMATFHSERVNLGAVSPERRNDMIVFYRKVTGIDPW